MDPRKRRHARKLSRKHAGAERPDSQRGFRNAAESVLGDRETLGESSRRLWERSEAHAGGNVVAESRRRSCGSKLRTRKPLRGILEPEKRSESVRGAVENVRENVRTELSSRKYAAGEIPRNVRRTCVFGSSRFPQPAIYSDAHTFTRRKLATGAAARPAWRIGGAWRGRRVEASEGAADQPSRTAEYRHPR